MKTKRKLLALTKIKVAKINSYNIIGKGTMTNVDCAVEESRTPKGGRTQTETYAIDCEFSV